MTSPEYTEYTGPDTQSRVSGSIPPSPRFAVLLQNAETLLGAGRDWVCVTNCACRWLIPIPRLQQHQQLLHLPGSPVVPLPAAASFRRLLLWRAPPKTLRLQHPQSVSQNLGVSTHTTGSYIHIFTTFMLGDIHDFVL